MIDDLHDERPGGSSNSHETRCAPNKTGGTECENEGGWQHRACKVYARTHERLTEAHRPHARIRRGRERKHERKHKGGRGHTVA